MGRSVIIFLKNDPRFSDRHGQPSVILRPGWEGVFDRSCREGVRVPHAFPGLVLDKYLSFHALKRPHLFPNCMACGRGIAIRTFPFPFSTDSSKRLDLVDRRISRMFSRRDFSLSSIHTFHRRAVGIYLRSNMDDFGLEIRLATVTKHPHIPWCQNGRIFIALRHSG
ncbi:hypothetical protein P152DRAFT_310626 [Eremomyces bilateralis CBS 781.70]|uniref:Uncharacterized protein n=1 Tax=Eremomyces bilateralis CBS 781.70 TaxID=1392243 RepID=A0A6G1G5S6_9PEZI|nr:uncharacterized protein P152DRAFT_310626 [Eremomyces bilateralis CBS 781.70]KAF1813230.1 hypothetical protein P152DRAFT_310626 [Eremomyces bilateralis CBS 781.70]